MVNGLEKDKIKPIREDIEEDSDLYMFKETEGEEEKDILKDLKIDKKVERKKSEDNDEDNDDEKEEKMVEKKSPKAKKNIKRKKKMNFGLVSGIVIIILILSVVVYNVYKWNDNDNLTGAVVAEIGGEKVTQVEFDKIYSEISARFPSVEKELVLEQMVNQIVLLHEADKKGITADDIEVENLVQEQINSIKAMFSEEELETQLVQQGITFEGLEMQMRDEYKKSLIINKLINESVLQKEEILIPEQIKAAHILVETLEEANEVLVELEGNDFGEVAKERSIGPSAPNGGDLGWFGKGQMVKEFEDIAFSLSPGDVSEPVQTQFGYHVIKIEDKKTAETKLLSDLTPEEKDGVLGKIQELVDSYIQDLKSKTDIQIFNEVLNEELVSVSKDEEEVVETLPATGLVTKDDITTFEDSGDEVCMEDGKPIIRLFSTTWCPHCKWVSSTFDNVVKEYADKGQIVAYHWELDKGEDLLTAEIENGIPESEVNIYKKYNPDGGVPTFVFGCKYIRVGNGYESQDDLAAEQAEFRAVIEELVS